MVKDIVFPLVVGLGLVLAAIRLFWEMRFALREGYFRYTFVTGWMFRDTDRYGSPILFLCIFCWHVLIGLVVVALACVAIWGLAETLTVHG